VGDSVWTEHHEAWLSLVEAEVAMTRVYAVFADAPPVEARAFGRRHHGWALALGATPRGAEVVRAAANGEVHGLLSHALALELDDLAPVLLHHLALGLGALAEAMLGRELVGRDAAARGAVVERAAACFSRSLSAWARLAADPDYLVAQAQVLAPNEPALATPDEVTAFVAARVDDLVKLGRENDVDSPRVQAVALALRQVERVFADHPRESLRRAPRVARVGAIDAALGAIDAALEVARAENHALAQRFAVVERVLPVWHTWGRELSITTFALQRAEPLLWESRRSKQWALLRRHVAQVEPLIASLVDRVRAGEVAWAALAAAFLVFQADATESLPDQVERCELALRLCPGHPNARVFLAFFLARQALVWHSTKARGHDELRAIYRRASELDPDDQQVKELGRVLAAS
jgi:hypothetical protein